MTTKKQVYKPHGKVKAASKPLTDEQKALQREHASCCIIVKFRDGNSIKKWSNEWAQPHKGGLEEWIRELKRVFEIYWRKNAADAAIFDVRFQKDCIGSERDQACNKLFQFTNGEWRAVAK